MPEPSLPVVAGGAVVVVLAFAIREVVRGVLGAAGADAWARLKRAGRRTPRVGRGAVTVRAAAVLCERARCSSHRPGPASARRRRGRLGSRRGRPARGRACPPPGRRRPWRRAGRARAPTTGIPAARAASRPARRCATRCGSGRAGTADSVGPENRVGPSPRPSTHLVGSSVASAPRRSALRHRADRRNVSETPIGSGRSRWSPAPTCATPLEGWRTLVRDGRPRSTTAGAGPHAVRPLRTRGGRPDRRRRRPRRSTRRSCRPAFPRRPARRHQSLLHPVEAAARGDPPARRRPPSNAPAGAPAAPKAASAVEGAAVVSRSGGSVRPGRRPAAVAAVGARTIDPSPPARAIGRGSRWIGANGSASFCLVQVSRTPPFAAWNRTMVSRAPGRTVDPRTPLPALSRWWRTRTQAPVAQADAVQPVDEAAHVRRRVLVVADEAAREGVDDDERRLGIEVRQLGQQGREVPVVEDLDGLEDEVAGVHPRPVGPFPGGDPRRQVAAPFGQEVDDRPLGDGAPAPGDAGGDRAGQVQRRERLVGAGVAGEGGEGCPGQSTPSTSAGGGSIASISARPRRRRRRRVAPVGPGRAGARARARLVRVVEDDDVGGGIGGGGDRPVAARRRGAGAPRGRGRGTRRPWGRRRTGRRRWSRDSSGWSGRRGRRGDLGRHRRCRDRIGLPGPSGEGCRRQGRVAAGRQAPRRGDPRRDRTPAGVPRAACGRRHRRRRPRRIEQPARAG